MNWLSSFFSSASSSTTNARRKMALSTHDAFSLPTTSPGANGRSYAHTTLSTRDADSLPSPSSYAYPPSSSSPTTYDYVPRQNGRHKPAQGQGAPGLLPLHNTSPMSPHAPYPPLEQTWARLRRWLSREYPELGDTLNYGILPQDFADIEMALGVALPPSLRDSYLLVDGQEAESSAGCSDGLFFGLQFLPLDDVLDEWRFWREVDGDPATGANTRLRAMMRSVPKGWVRAEYTHRGWIPLVTDKGGNYLGIDLDPEPGQGGVPGQVIVFGRDFDTKVVLWRGDGPNGWAHWLAGFVDDLEGGEGFELGQVSDGSEGEEDDVGYESYFFDGAGRSKGEGAGDTGGGLRLTGEYRGWSVLEAWADKSVKRWREAGLLRDTDTPTGPSDSKAKGIKHGLGVLDLSAAVAGTGDEAPIHIFANSEDDSTPTAALTNYSKGAPDVPTSEKSPPAVPTISVTKPPAPKPVNLPSPQDFTSSSPTDSRTTSFDADLEQGRQLSLDEIEHPLSGAPVAVKPQSPTTPTPQRTSDHTALVKEGTLVQIPPSDDPTPTPPTKAPTPAVPDLLQNESSDRVLIMPIEPVASPVAKRQPELPADESIGDSSEPSSETLNVTPPTSSETIASDAQAEDGPSAAAKAELLFVEPMEPAVAVPPAAAEIPEQPEEDADPDTTIRLIGGGGVSGVVAEPEPVELPSPPVEAASPDNADVASLSSVATGRDSIDSTASGVVPSTPSGKSSKREKKKGFSSGLKRISKLGSSGNAKRRTESKDKVVS